MKGWVRVNRGKKRITHYVVIPWDAMEGSGQKKKWHFKFDKRGDRFESYKHAERFLEFLRSFIDEGTFNPLDWAEAKPHGFEELKAQYLKHYEEKLFRGEISPSTLSGKRRYMESYLEPFFRGLDVKYVANLTLAQFYNQLPKRKAKTRFNIMTETHRFFQWCKDQGVIKGDVPRYTEMAKLKQLAQEERPPVREDTHMMSDEDFAATLEAMNKQDRPIFGFIRITGCRTSEARALQRFDFDWKSRIFEIRRTWADADGGEVLVERAKSGSQRLLKITDNIEAIVREVPPLLETPFIFYNPKTGTAYTRRELGYRWGSALKKAGLPHISLKNATRANAACTWLKLGYSYEEVGTVLGHKHVATTKHYGQIFVDQTASLLERRTKTAGTSLEPKTKKAK